MFTDVVAYSRLMARNEAAAILLLSEYRRIVSARVHGYGGEIVEHIGDAVLARFLRAEDAIRAALNIQTDIADFNQQADPPPGQALASEPKSYGQAPSVKTKLRVRIGVHQGAVGIGGSTISVDDVSVVSRLPSLIAPGSVCVSAVAFDAARGELKVPWRALGMRRAGNRGKMIPVYLVKPTDISWSDRLHYCSQLLTPSAFSAKCRAAAVCVAIMTVPFALFAISMAAGSRTGKTVAANTVEIAEFRSVKNGTGVSDYFGAGVTESIHMQLSGVPNIQFVNANEGVIAPVRLEGSVQQSGQGLRIAYRLVRRDNSLQIGGGEFSGASADIFHLQSQVADDVAKRLAEEFDFPRVGLAPRVSTSNVEAYDHYLQGRDYLQRAPGEEFVDRAIIHFAAALTLDNDFALANLGMCQAYTTKSQSSDSGEWLGQAQIYCRSTQRQSENDPAILDAVGTAYMDAGLYEQALQVLRQSMRLNPSRPDAYIALARLQSLKGQVKAAEITFRTAIKKSPAFWRVRQEFGTFLITIGRHHDAAEQFRQVLQLAPRNARAYSSLGSVHLHFGEFREAAEAFAESGSLFPLASVYSNSGVMHYFAGDLRRASEMFEKAVAIDPNNYRWLTNYADVLRQLPGREDDARQFYAKAAGLATLAIEANSRDLVALRHLVICHLFLEEYGLANAYLEKVPAPEPADTSSSFQVLRIMALTGNIKEAVAHSNQLVHMGYAKELMQPDAELKSLRKRRDFLSDIGQ